ncbi:hypothetical protein V5O48_001191 [Marasmius crinis-equi]|uniref:Uncharacterized protein n=1 Tax=Marasmius crinis-equi TaxID=585013 RepID=A0ABR3FZ33_9AGAR
MCTPSFLTPLPDQSSQNRYINAIFKHKDPLGDAHSLWWPSYSPKAVVLFIPGNPGLVEFYIPFLSALYTAKSQEIAILAHAHINHTPGIVSPAAEHTLTIQVQAALEAFDALNISYPPVPITIIGHSVVPSVIVDTLFRHWPQPQIAVLCKLLYSPSSIFACLSMAHDEMNNILALDTQLLKDYHHLMHMFFVEGDEWVGTEEGAIIRLFQSDPGSLKIVRRTDDIPHAFCIKHGDEVAKQCADWLVLRDETLDQA